MLMFIYTETFEGSSKIYLHFLSFLCTDMALDQVLENHVRKKQGILDPAEQPWRLMIWGLFY